MDETPEGPVHAYHDRSFLDSRNARPLRILSEYLEPLGRFDYHKVEDTVVFMGSARTRSRETALQELETAKRDGGDICLCRAPA